MALNYPHNNGPPSPPQTGQPYQHGGVPYYQPPAADYRPVSQAHYQSSARMPAPGEVEQTGLGGGFTRPHEMPLSPVSPPQYHLGIVSPGPQGYSSPPPQYQSQFQYGGVPGAAFPPYTPAPHPPQSTRPAFPANTDSSEAIISTPPQEGSQLGPQLVGPPMAKLTLDFASMTMGPGSIWSPTATPTSAREPHAKPVPPGRSPPRPEPAPFTRASGPWNVVITDCPETTVIDYSLSWYQLRAVPDFLICSCCHQKQVKGSALESEFDLVQRVAGTPSICRFWVPRIVDVLWPDALRTKDLSELISYMTRRFTILDCKGTAGVSAESQVKWFGVVDGELPGFLACEACHEDRIVGTAFESRFQPYHLTQTAGETWTCDACIPYISLALREHSKAGKTGWLFVVDAVKRRTPLPPCKGELVPREQLKWFEPKQRVDGMVICQTCYLDKVALTEFGPEFVAHTPNPNNSSRHYLCDMAALPMQIAFNAALRRHHYKVFWDAANLIKKLPPCNAEGHAGGTWYSLAPFLGGPLTAFDVCSACHAGIIQPLGLSAFFLQVPRDPSVSLVCDFGPAGPRRDSYMLLLGQSVSVGVITPLAEHIATFAGIPPCQRDTKLVNAVWYGWPDAPFCTDCYHAVAIGSLLDASGLALRAAKDPRPTMCALYSPRMRLLFQSCCATGSPEPFVAAARHRLAVRGQVEAQIEALSSEREGAFAGEMHGGAPGPRDQGMTSLAARPGTSSGSYMYGNNGMGYSGTWVGATAAHLMDQSWRQWREAMANVEDTVAIANLQLQWRAVE